MKRFLILFAISFVISMCSYASIGDVLTNAADSAYHDGKALVDTVYHDGKTVIGTVYSDLKEGAVGLYPDVKEAVISIGKAIGVAAEHVYMVLVKKYVVIGVKQASICLLGLIALIVGLVMWKKATPKGQPITYRIIVPLLLMISGFITMCNVNYDEMLMGLINPEYGAINYILDYSKELLNK